MDPWYYNRLTNASSGFQPSASASTSDYPQQLPGHQGGTAPSVPSTSSQLLLQAAHSTTLASSSFNAAGFLSQPGYDVFSPLFQHAHSKAAHYSVSQHRTLASAMATSKSENDLSSLRENYSTAHHQTLTSTPSSYFDHQGTSSSSLGWHHQSASQLPSPFGVLPHESVVSSTANSSSSKTNPSDYPGFTAFNAAHGLSHLTSSLADYKSAGSYPDAKKTSRPHSPSTSVKSTASSSSSVPSTTAFYQSSSSSTPSPYGASPSDSGISSGYSPTGKYGSCVVSSPSVSSSKDYRPQQSTPRSSPADLYSTSINSARDKPKSPSFVAPGVKNSVSAPAQLPVQTKAQAKIYSDLADQPRRPDVSSEASVPGYGAKPARTPNGQQSPYHQVIGHQNSNASYRHYNTSTTIPTDGDYHRSKVNTSEQPPYTVSTQQNGQGTGTDCVSTSPHVELAPSPSYPMYNSSVHQSQHQQPDSTGNRTAPAPGPGSSPLRTLPQPLTYSSVITRTLVGPDSRSCESAQYAKQCWDASSSSERESAPNQRKYQSPAYGASNPAASYYDATTGASTNDSACRGDPLSIVKNLQQQEDSRPTNRASSSSSRRRKSSEKAPALLDYAAGRVPPPAHHNPSNTASAHPAAAQAPSGSYFDLERWNLPPQAARSFAGAQSTLHHPSNAFVGSQHQGLISPHASTYFSPFHLSTSPHPAQATHGAHSAPCQTPSHEYQSDAYANHHAVSHFPHTGSSSQGSVDPNAYPPSGIPPSAPASAPTPGPTPAPVPVHPEEIPKIKVPNIVEELAFLDDVGPVVVNKNETSKIRSSGFEASYLKFLQGEREASPPPASRAGRKAAWARSKPYQPQSNQPKAPEAEATGGPNGTTASPTSAVPSVSADKPPEFDPEDDPRYFPLPKTDAQRRCLDSSDSDSDIDLNTKLKNRLAASRQPAKPVTVKVEKPRSTSKSVKKEAPAEKGKRGRKRKMLVDQDQLPRRETSRRKAKERTRLNLESGDYFPDEPDPQGDSDSDPAWTPVAIKSKFDSSDDESGKKKSIKKGAKPVGPGRKKSKLSYDEDGESSPNEDRKSSKATNNHHFTQGPRGRRKSQNVHGVPSKNSSYKSSDDSKLDSEEIEAFPFKIGDFLVMKSDLNEEWPSIWRVDGKTLLQKFEPFQDKDETLYRNISTYSGWSPNNRHIYQSVEVKFRQQNRGETIVEFLRDELLEDHQEALEAFIKDTACYQDNFEVYIQTLISQALDSNFLTEIFQEKDEYFLSNVKTIDDIVDDKRKNLVTLVKWRSQLEGSIGTWPFYDVILELSADELRKNCASCNKPRVSARVLLYGQPYNSATLEGCQPDPKVSEKAILICGPCLRRIELYNKVAHQKYLMFIECAKRVAERRAAGDNKDTTAILNQLMADDKWLNELFRTVRMSWAEVDYLTTKSKAPKNSPSSESTETPKLPS